MLTENCPRLEEVEVPDEADFLKTTDDHVRRAFMRDAKDLSDEFLSAIRDAPKLELQRLYYSNNLNTNQFYAVIRELGRFFPKKQVSASAA